MSFISGRHTIKMYRLPLVMHEPTEDTENKYMAEVPAIPGCRAWGDTVATALENLESVAGEFIESYRSCGDSLPRSVVEEN